MTPATKDKLAAASVKTGLTQSKLIELCLQKSLESISVTTT